MSDEWERPLWVTKLRDFLLADIIEFIAEDGSEDAVTDQVTDAAMAVVCQHYGHHVEDDQCGRPDHRVCVWCQQRMPGVPVGNYRPFSESSHA